LGAVAAAIVADIAAFVAVRRAAPAARRGVAHSSALLAALTVVTVLAKIELLLAGWAMAVCNAYVLFHLDNMAETARRIRILRELREAPEAMTRQALLAAYSPREVFDRRVARLLLAGQCREEGGRLVATGDSYAAMERIVRGLARVVLPRR
jgi:hypothetical protein